MSFILFSTLISDLFWKPSQKRILNSCYLSSIDNIFYFPSDFSHGNGKQLFCSSKHCEQQMFSRNGHFWHFQRSLLSIVITRVYMCKINIKTYMLVYFLKLVKYTLLLSSRYCSTALEISAIPYKAAQIRRSLKGNVSDSSELQCPIAVPMLGGILPPLTPVAKTSNVAIAAITTVKLSFFIDERILQAES